MRAREHVRQSLKHADASPSPQRPGATRGTELDPGLRGAFEPRFDFDFSDVRIHAGHDASRVADALNARAVTMGQDIFFAEGEYDESSPDGLELIAHELTHVVQRANAGETRGDVSAASDAAEVEASHAAKTATSGGSVAPQSAPAALAREEKEKEAYESRFGKAGEIAKAPEDMGFVELLKHGLGEDHPVSKGYGFLNPLGSIFGAIGGFDKAAHSDSVVDIASGASGGVGSLFSLGGWGMSELAGNKEIGGGLGGLGSIFGAGSNALDAISAFRKGETGEGIWDSVKAVQGGAAGAASLGGFELGAVADTEALAALGGEGLTGAATLGPAAAVAGAGIGGYELGKKGLGAANTYAKKNDIFGGHRDSTDAAADAGIAVSDYFHDSWAGKAGDIFGDVAGGATSIVSSWGTAAYSGLHAAGSGIKDLFSGPSMFDVMQTELALRQSMPALEAGMASIPVGAEDVGMRSSSVAHEEMPPLPAAAAAPRRPR
jgi:hypothetical protein